MKKREKWNEQEKKREREYSLQIVMLLIQIIALQIMYCIFVNTVDRQIRRAKDKGKREERRGEERDEWERENQRN